MAVVRIILFLLLFPSVTSAVESCRNVYSQSGYALVDHAYKSYFTGRLASCYMSCNSQPTCQSLNYNLADKTCELNNDTKYFRPKYFVKKPTFVYAANIYYEFAAAVLTKTYSNAFHKFYNISIAICIEKTYKGAVGQMFCTTSLLPNPHLNLFSLLPK